MTKGQSTPIWFELQWVDGSQKADDDPVIAFIGKLSQAIKALARQERK